VSVFSRFIFLVLGLSLLASPSPAVADASSSTVDISFHPVADLKSAYRESFDRQNEYLLAGGVAAFVLSREFDPMARDQFAHQHRWGHFEDWGNNILGTGVPGAVIGAGLWSWGYWRNSAFEVHAGQAELETLAVTALATELLKRTVARERPDGSDRLAFPSGHTSTVAAASAALSEFYGLWAALPGIALTLVTAEARMAEDKHWLSDTVGGAAIGIFVAHAFANVHRENKKTEAKTWAVWPLIAPKGQLEVVALQSF
jgi:PAP2 superfamily